MSPHGGVVGGAVGGHRRDQSDSRIPLRPSAQEAPSSTPPHLRAGGPPDTTELCTFNKPLHSSSGSLSNGAVVALCMGDPADPAPHHSPTEQAAQQWEESQTVFKTVVAFLCLQVSAFLNFFLLTVIHDVVPRQPLPDLVFMAIPQQRWAWAVGDVLSTFSAIVGFTVMGLHERRWLVLRRVFLLGAIMYGLRAIVLGVTFLPPSFHNRDEICQPQVNRTAMYATEVATRFVTYVVTLGLTSGQEKILCGDLMFSGHTVVLTIMYFAQLHYTPRKLTWLRYLITPVTFCGIAALVVSGGHYTMDVLIAYWLTSHVFWSYHQMFEQPRHIRAKSPLSRLWWFWLCYWFEADSPPGPLPNRWDWPLPGPAFMHAFVARINHKLM